MSNHDGLPDPYQDDYVPPSYPPPRRPDPDGRPQANTGEHPTAGHYPAPEHDGAALGIGRHLNRRTFLQALVASGALASGAGIIYSGREKVERPTVAQPSTQMGVVTRANADPDTAGSLIDGAIDNRVLVVVEMQGGNDGLSMVIPYGSGAYYDLRPDVAIPQEEVLPLNDEIGLHPNLARLHQRGVGIVEGVGPIEGNLSHFEMVQRWDRADVDGKGELRSGFLARFTDTVDNGSPLVGLSVSGSTPRFANSRSSTLALDNPNALWYLAAQSDNENLRAFHESLRAFAYDESEMAGMVGSSWNQLLDLGTTVNEQIDREDDETNPMFTDGGRLGRQLSVAADLIAADVGVRVVHASIGGFDTHERQRGRHDNLMAQLDASIDGFLQQVAADGAADRVLVATTSEFGRRAAENEAGTDHGSGSVMFVAGAGVTPGRYGVAPSLANLDRRGNIPTEVPFDTYLGTLAQNWLGIEAGSVLPRGPELLPLAF
ncbi:MAG: DUF1501 domain-containing protein [Actinomycetota bacterium]